MEPGRASRTAEHNALFRALETHRPPGERLVDDPLSAAFLAPTFRAVAAAARTAPGRAAVFGVIDSRWPGVRTSLVARTALIDRLIELHVADTSQLVILGAGFDTRAWRLDALRSLDAVFEVDHPDTQRRKRLVLERRHVDGADVRFVPTDFHLGRLSDAMREQAYDPSAPTTFLWEGTTNYLDDDAVTATLRWCAAAAPASRLIFTYINADVLVDPDRYVGTQRMLSTIGRSNERMTFGIEPDHLAGYLADRGLELLSDIGAAEYRRDAYGAAASTMRGHEFYRVAQARIPVGAR